MADIHFMKLKVIEVWCKIQKQNWHKIAQINRQPSKPSLLPLKEALLMRNNARFYFRKEWGYPTTTWCLVGYQTWSVLSLQSKRKNRCSSVPSRYYARWLWWTKGEKPFQVPWNMRCWSKLYRGLSTSVILSIKRKPSLKCYIMLQKRTWKILTTNCRLSYSTTHFNILDAAECLTQRLSKRAAWNFSCTLLCWTQNSQFAAEFSFRVSFSSKMMLSDYSPEANNFYFTFGE